MGFLDGDSDHFERCQAGACRLDLETVYRACGRGSGSILFLRARMVEFWHDTPDVAI